MSFNTLLYCYLCGKEFSCPIGCRGCDKCYGLGGKVRDHDHLIDHHNYRGSAHHKCNLAYRKDQFKVPLIAHNSFRYDIQFIIEELAKYCFPEYLKEK